MLSTKNIILDYKEVPETWIFEYYCDLNSKLTGQDVKIKSLFNKKDSVPSMCIYYNKQLGTYKFKDFSTGEQGNAINLVMKLFGTSFKDTTYKLINDYSLYLSQNKQYNVGEFREYSKFKVTSFSACQWTVLDRDFWVRYNIGSSLLRKYNVQPLNEYTMERIGDDGDTQSITVSGDYIYGYFKSDGSLYKIYQPKSTKKFIKVKPYIQGSDQLENNSKLLITSSLKDIMSIKSLGLNVDCIAPDSENTMIPRNDMLRYLETYKDGVSVLFDNDDAGVKAMKKYKEHYDVGIFILPLSKDPSDSIKDHGVKKVLYTLVPLLQRSYERVSL